MILTDSKGWCRLWALLSMYYFIPLLPRVANKLCRLL
jgi:hypothetical protein